MWHLRMHIRNNPDMTQQRNVPRKSQSTKQVDPSITCRIKGSPAQSKTTSTATMNPCSFHIAANQRRRACSPDPDYTRIRGDAHCTSQHATPPKLLVCTPFCSSLATTSAGSPLTLLLSALGKKLWKTKHWLHLCVMAVHWRSKFGTGLGRVCGDGFGVQSLWTVWDTCWCE